MSWFLTRESLFTEWSDAVRSLRAISVGLVLGLTVYLHSAYSQRYSVVSPAAVRRLSGLAETMEGKYAISMSSKNLARVPIKVTHFHIEGLLPHQGSYDASMKAFAELRMMRDFALAYRLTGDRRYLDKASQYINAWVTYYQLSFNPIDESGLDSLMLTNDLCRDDFTPALRHKIDIFLRKMVKGYLLSISQLNKPDSTNWQSIRIKLITMGSFALGDTHLIEAARTLYKKQIGENIHPDGSVEDFHQRDALHYVTYDLNPLLLAADAAYAHGMDWFHWKSPVGSSLYAAVNWLVPYAQGNKRHEEFVHSDLPFDQERVQAGAPGFGKIWDPKEGLETLGLAAAMDSHFRLVVDQLRSKPGYYVNHWIVLAIWRN